jgi:hypothetical protein
VSCEQLCEPGIGTGTDDGLIDYDQPDWTAIGLVGADAER